MTEKEILVVDDEVSILTMLTKAFNRAGFSVVTAEGARQALDILKDRHIQVMFLDLNMPEMNGLELCKAIRKDRPMAIIYGITGYASLFELADCREAGFDDYFTKPVNLNVLYRAVEDAFEKMKRWKQRTVRSQ